MLAMACPAVTPSRATRPLRPPPETRTTASACHLPGDDRQLYQALIDELVRECREGQGQIGPSKARTGTWNPHTTLFDSKQILRGRPEYLCDHIGLYARLHRVPD